MLLAATAAATSLAACGSSPRRFVERTTAPSSLPSPKVTTPSQEVIAAYREMWADFVAASQTSDYQSPLLSQYSSGDALSLLVHGLYMNMRHGIVTKGRPLLHPQVTSLSPTAYPTQATITDCFDDTHWLEYTSSGDLLDSVPGGHHATTAILQESNGVWKVCALVLQDSGTC